MMPALVIGDLTQTEQRKTFYYVIPVALVSILPSILLSPYHLIQVGVFLLYTFMAIYVRKFGIRWIALGIISFMSYFAPLFFPIHLNLIPLVVLTALISVGTTFLLKFYVFPDKAEKTFTSYINAFNKLYAQLVIEKNQGKIINQQSLNELTLIIEGFSSSGGSLSLKSRAEALQMALFEREMNLLFSDKPVFNPITMDELEMKEVVTELSSIAPLIPQGLSTTTKTAIQGTLATAAASFMGVWISPERWYWASMTAFVIFVGSSRGETLLRASYRVTGTVIGLFVGIAINPMIAGHKNLEWSLIIASLFFGMYAMRFAFGFWSASIFTFLLTILFDVMGLLTNNILLIRFEETLLGALIGAVVSALVLPTSTKKVTTDALTTVLKSQLNVLNALPVNKEDREGKRKLVKALRQMDKDFGTLKMVSAPLIGKLTMMKRGEMPTIIHHVTLFGHSLRHLSTQKVDSVIDVEQKIQDLKSATSEAIESLSMDSLNRLLALYKT